jgi:PPM family protein phosphatase
MIRNDHAHLQVAALSDAGILRRNNEDRFAISAYRISPTDPTPSLFAVLCDGIGGHRAGEVAAELAVDSISRLVAESDGKQPVQILKSAIYATSLKIFEQAQANPGQKGMGATCACAWIIGNRLYTVSVGDSRIYLQRGKSIHQLTTDHTLIQEMMDQGQISSAEAHNHPNAHMIRRYLGSPEPPEGDFRLRITPGDNDEQALSNQGFIVRPGDKILICSDGLTDLVSDAEIAKNLGRSSPEMASKQHPETNREPPDLEQSARDLVSLANRRGGRDNITVIVMRMPGQTPELPSQAWFQRKWQLALVGGLAMIFMGLFAGDAYLGINWLQGQVKTVPMSHTLAIFPSSPPPGDMQNSGTPGPAGLQISSSPNIQTPGFTSTLGVKAGPTLTSWPTNTQAATIEPTKGR